MLLTLLLSCDGAEPATTPTPTPALPEPAAGAVETSIDTAALLAAGLCQEFGEIIHTEPHRLTDGRVLIEANCMMAAYQGVFEYAWADGNRPVSDQNGQLLSVVGLPTFETDSGTLRWLSKARGVGDCGDHYIYAVQGDQLQQREHRSRDCDDDVEVKDIPPPEAWPLVEATGHCVAGEAVYFSCPTSSTKALSLCGGGGTVQYRFGPPGDPELVFPDDSSPAAFTVRTESYARAIATIASFTNGDINYQVTDSSGSGGIDAESNNFQGVTVFQGDKLLATVSCQGLPQTSWEALKAATSSAP